MPGALNPASSQMDEEQNPVLRALAVSALVVTGTVASVVAVVALLLVIVVALLLYPILHTKFQRILKDGLGAGLGSRIGAIAKEGIEALIQTVKDNPELQNQLKAIGAAGIESSGAALSRLWTRVSQDPRSHELFAKGGDLAKAAVRAQIIALAQDPNFKELVKRGDELADAAIDAAIAFGYDWLRSALAKP